MPKRRISDFIYECGQLKKNPRTGWLSIGIKDCESIADHSWRTAVIGLLLAKLEKADEEKVLKLCLLHDIHEARLGDLNYLSSRYVKKDRMRAAKDICKGLFCAKEIESIMKELFEMKTKAAIIAKDADLLDMIAQAREYMDSGNKYAKEWIPDAKRKLKTKSAKKIAKELAATSSNSFWMRLPPL